KKGANYDKDWADIIAKPAEEDADFIYLYVHFGNVQFNLGKKLTHEWSIEGEYAIVDEKVIKRDVVITDVDVIVTVYDADDNVVDPNDFDALPLGLYTVVYKDAQGGTFTDEVEVKAGETTTSSYSAKYKEKAEPIIKTIHRPDIVNPVVITDIVVVK
ncbi:MAG: hypothetical protein FWH37_09765, partial [Candidatus Bathyarchaeota archaeon]|nr:hypothetical protein [Candidatus Termiticorpusculum sp.]